MQPLPVTLLAALRIPVLVRPVLEWLRGKGSYHPRRKGSPGSPGAGYAAASDTHVGTSHARSDVVAGHRDRTTGHEKATGSPNLVRPDRLCIHGSGQ